MENLVGKVIRGYEMHELIGEGGFGAVYRATQTAVDREVAIKVILPQYASRPEFIRKFEAEAKLVARLEHLHIVSLIDYWRDPEGAFLVLRWLKGGTLRESLREEGPWDPRAAAKLFAQVAAALAVAHRNNVVHRDVKPANILLDEEGNGYLSDFGIAHDTMEDAKAPAGSSSSGSGSGVTGSAGYISPEQVNMQPVSARSDIYSMTIVLYEMLAGHHPYPDARSAIALFIKHTSEPLPVLEDFPEAVNRVLQKGAAKNPEERYEDILEMARDFKQAVAEAAMPAGERASGIFLEDFDTTSVQSPLRDAEAVVNPYKGLRAFQEGDADDFYGREQLIQQLLGRMTEDHSLSRFLAVVGPSGSGKSSVVKAGLIPALRKGAITGSQNWFYIEMVPGSNPLTELEDGLLSITANPLPNLALRLRASPQALHDAVWEALPDDDSELVIMIDQFEEAFTQGTDEERVAFLENIQEAISAPDSRLRVFVTLRADFYDRPLMVAKFSTLMQQRTEVVVPLTIEELERAITAPARRVKVFFQQGLSAAIVSEVSEQPGVLPMLQYALTELFERREGQILTLSAYQELGGVLGALARRADEIYQELDAPRQEATRQLFLRLVTLGEGTEDTRRRALVSELMEAAADQKIMQEIIDKFGSFRLLTFDRDPITRTPTVEVAHEALIREWKLLRQWLDEGRADVRLQRMLSAAATDWQNAKREPSFLLRGGRLVQFEDWIQRTTVGLTKNDREFFEASLVERDRMEKEEARRRDQELRNARRLRRLSIAGLIGAILFSVAVLIALGVALQQNSVAEVARADALNQAGTAVAAQANAITQAAIAQTAQGEAVNLASTAVLAQAEALTQAAIATNALGQSEIDANNAQTQAAAAQTAQQNAVVQANVAGTAQSNAVDQAATATFAQGDAINQANLAGTAQSNAVAQANVAGTAQDDAINQANLASTAQANAVKEALASQSLALSASAGQLVSSNSPLALKLAIEANSVPNPSLQAQRVLISIVYNAPRRRYESTHGSINCIGMIDDSHAVTCNADGTLTQWDLTEGKVIATYEGHKTAVNAIDISKDGSRMASGSQDGTLIIWNVATGEALFTIDKYKSAINSVSFNGNSQVVTGAADGKIVIWSVFDGREQREVIVTTNVVSDVQYDNTGRYLVIAAGDAARVWDIGTQSQLLFSETQTLRISDATFTPDGDLIITSGAGGNGIPQVWDGKTRKLIGPLPAHNGPVNSIAVDADSRLVVTSSDDFSVILSDLRTQTEVRRFNGHTSRVNAAVFTPNGQFVLSGAGDGVMYLWDTTPSANPQQSLADIETSVSSAFFTPGGNLMAVSDNGQISLWDGRTSRLISSRNLGRSELSATTLALSPRSTASDLIIARGTTDLLIYDFPQSSQGQGKELQRFTVPEERAFVSDIAFSADGKYVVWGGGYFYRDQLVQFTRIGLLRVWDVDTGEIVKDFPNIVPRITQTNDLGTPQAIINEGVNASVSAVAFSPDGTRLVAGFENGRILMWDMTRPDTGPLLEFTGHSSAVNTIIFNEGPSGLQMLTGGADRAVLLWDPETGSLLRRFTGHTGSVNAIAFYLDGAEIISASEDRSLRLWDSQTGEQIQKFGEQDAPISAMAIEPQTSLVLIGTLEGRLFTRRLDDASELVKWADENRFLPDLSCGQRDQFRVQPLCTDEERNAEKGLDIFADLATSTPLPPLEGTGTPVDGPPPQDGTPGHPPESPAGQGTPPPEAYASPSPTASS